MRVDFGVFGPKRKLMWDLWFIKDKGLSHVFYLQAQRSCDVKKRHRSRVSIGHATSKNLLKWKELETALLPGVKGEWDDLALWTGSVIKRGKKFYMFYTGRANGRDKKLIQKIGLAVSDDLKVWKKFDGNPILEADVRFYDMKNGKNALGKIGAWRDPWVFKDPKSGKYYMTISARERGRKKEYNGCVALAESSDLINWKVRKPILAPGIYDEMETTKVIYHKGVYYLFFTVSWDNLYKPSWAKKVGTHAGLHCYYSKNLFSGYRPVNGNGVVLDGASEISDVRVMHDKGDEYTAIGWLNNDSEGNFIGRMSYKFKIVINGAWVFEKHGGQID